jgi:hypothetical protein
MEMAEQRYHSIIQTQEYNISRLLSKCEVLFEYSVVVVVLGCFAIVILTKTMLKASTLK